MRKLLVLSLMAICTIGTTVHATAAPPDVGQNDCVLAVAEGKSLVVLVLL